MMRRLLVAMVAVAIMALVVLQTAMALPIVAATPGGDASAWLATVLDPGSAFPPATASGVPVLLAEGWAPIVNVSDNPGSSGSPVLGVDSAGVVHAAWYDNNPGNWEILYATHAPTGTWSFPENVSANASYSLVPAMVIEHNDSVDIVWQDYGGPSRLAWQGTLENKSRLAGQDFEPPLLISATTGFGGYPEVRDASLAVDSHNTVHLVWAGNTAGGYRILYSQKAADGRWSFPSVVNPGDGSAFHPHLTIDSADVLYLVWEETVAANTQSDIYYSSQRPDGTWAPALNVSQNPGQSQEAWLLADVDRTLHLVWRDYTPDPAQAEILYATKPLGGDWGAATNVSNSPGDSAGPRLVEDAARTLHLVWYDNTPNNWEILYASKPQDGSWTSGVNVSNSPGRSGQPSLIYDPKGKLHLAWADDSAGQFEMFYTSKEVPVFGTSYKLAPAAALAGQDLAYRLILRNPSGAPVTLFVTDSAPIETVYVDGSAQASAGSVTVAGSEVRWTGVVPARGQVEVRFLATVLADTPVGTVVRNRASISDAAGTSIDVEASTRIYLTRMVAPLIVSSF